MFHARSSCNKVRLPQAFVSYSLFSAFLSEVVESGVRKHLGRLLPDTLPNFSAARYDGEDHIAAHDDLVPEAYTTEEVSQAKLHQCLVSASHCR